MRSLTCGEAEGVENVGSQEGERLGAESAALPSSHFLPLLPGGARAQKYIQTAGLGLLSYIRAASKRQGTHCWRVICTAQITDAPFFALLEKC